MKNLIVVCLSLWLSSAVQAKDTAHATDKTLAAESKQSIELSVTDKGFEPSSINIKPDTAAELRITRKTDSTCAKQVNIPSLKIKKDLPLNELVVVDLGKLKKGEIRFGCSMDMMAGGQIHVQ